MDNHTRRLIFLFLFVPFLLGAKVSVGFGVSLGGGTSGTSPYLIFPCTENVSLKDKEVLDFRWRPSGLAYIRGYDFKLYKGFKTTEEHILLNERINRPVRSYPIPVEAFNEGDLYSWVLTEVRLGGRKSDSSTCSFEIKKR